MPGNLNHHRAVSGTQSFGEGTGDDCSSSSSSSSSQSWPSPCFSSTTSSSCYPLTSSTPEDELSEDDVGSLSSSPESASFYVTWENSHPSGEAAEEQDEDEDEGPSTSWQAQLSCRAPPRSTSHDKVSDMVAFLLQKYRCKEHTSKAEMLSRVLQGEQEHFANTFRQASACMQLVFGVDVQELEPDSNIFTLVNTLGLTLDSTDSLPKMGILVLVLSVIYMEGERASEEEVWDALRVMGVYSGQKHDIYGEPRELLTRVWVQERYLQYEQAAGSWPPRYDFLWGSRAHMETNKLKILQFLANINESDPRAFPLWYEKALKERQDQSQDKVDELPSTVGASPGVPSRSLSPK
ncbi:melanoma-associated antigen 10 [Erinaceus europaeus]|uniref:Melanoma-associated antigen 10 n=1 Tax=Erinaceus europaeus TaxID=9365 RepID=A0A1S3A7A8_ERIEU|nr:melanoma-associated antigen 10 [Erinaceus europaeus]XP_060038580.1 melanoma-associated antigen 10 [Erinaceus europaeus]